MSPIVPRGGCGTSNGRRVGYAGAVRRQARALRVASPVAVERPSRGKHDAILDPVTLLCLADGLPEPSMEFQFHPPRRWKFDRAWVASMIAVEIEGGIWTRGRHTRGTGFLKDIEKYNQAQMDGWIVLRTTPQTIHLLRPFLQQALR